MEPPLGAHRLGLAVPLLFACVVSPIQPLVGHFAGQRLTDEQPIKLAAMEGLAETTESAPLELGGFWNGEELVGAIEVPIPGLLSFLSANDFDATIIGLNSVPPEDQPPVGIVHVAFQTMVALGTFLALLSTIYLFLLWRRRDPFEHVWLLRAIAVSG